MTALFESQFYPKGQRKSLWKRMQEFKLSVYFNCKKKKRCLRTIFYKNGSRHKYMLQSKKTALIFLPLHLSYEI